MMTALQRAGWLDAVRRKEVNLVSPTLVIDELPAMMKLSVRMVTIDPQNETYKAPGSSKVCLHKVALDKIAATAQVSWEIIEQADDWNDPHRVKYRVAGWVKNLDGSLRKLQDIKVIDLRGEKGWPDEDLGSDAREYIRTTRTGDPWTRIYAARQHIDSLCVSKAKNRAIRSLGVPVAMPMEQAVKPWVVVALVPDYDTSDPEVRRMLVAHQLGSQAALYGPPAGVALSPGAPEIDVTDMVEDVDAVPDPPAPEVIDAEPDPPEDTTTDPWDEGEVLTPELPLPVPEEILMRIPTHDEQRMRYLGRINEYARRILQLQGEVTGALTIDKIAAGFDPLESSIDDIVAVGRALKEVVTGERADNS